MRFGERCATLLLSKDEGTLKLRFNECGKRRTDFGNRFGQTSSCFMAKSANRFRADRGWLAVVPELCFFACRGAGERQVQSAVAILGRSSGPVRSSM